MNQICDTTVANLKAKVEELLKQGKIIQDNAVNKLMEAHKHSDDAMEIMLLGKCIQDIYANPLDTDLKFAVVNFYKANDELIEANTTVKIFKEFQQSKVCELITRFIENKDVSLEEIQTEITSTGNPFKIRIDERYPNYSAFRVGVSENAYYFDRKADMADDYQRHYDRMLEYEKKSTRATNNISLAIETYLAKLQVYCNNISEAFGGNPSEIISTTSHNIWTGKQVNDYSDYNTEIHMHNYYRENLEKYNQL